MAKHDRTHFSLRITETNAKNLELLTKKFHDNPNSTVNHLLQLASATIAHPWSAVRVRRIRHQVISALTYNGNAAKFKAALSQPKPNK